MALNPHMLPNRMPVPFVNEIFILFRGGLKFKIDQIRLPGRRSFDIVEAMGSIFLTNIRMVFVADTPVEGFFAYDLPLLHIHGQHFPDFYNREWISGFVEPVIAGHEAWPVFSSMRFTIEFKIGECGTFAPLFFNVIASVRRYNRHYSSSPEQRHERFDPLQASRNPVHELIRSPTVDPNDPTMIFFQQPNLGSSLRRSHYLINLTPSL